MAQEKVDAATNGVTVSKISAYLPSNGAAYETSPEVKDIVIGSAARADTKERFRDTDMDAEAKAYVDGARQSGKYAYAGESVIGSVLGADGAIFVAMNGQNSGGQVDTLVAGGARNTTQKALVMGKNYLVNEFGPADRYTEGKTPSAVAHNTRAIFRAMKDNTDGAPLSALVAAVHIGHGSYDNSGAGSMFLTYSQVGNAAAVIVSKDKRGRVQLFVNPTTQAPGGTIPQTKPTESLASFGAQVDSTIINLSEMYRNGSADVKVLMCTGHVAAELMADKHTRRQIEKALEIAKDNEEAILRILGIVQAADKGDASIGIVDVIDKHGYSAQGKSEGRFSWLLRR